MNSDLNSKTDSSKRKNTMELTELLTQRLIDQSIIERYGTSLKISMGREYTEYLNEKYEKLKKEFKVIDKNSDNEITFDELYDFLDLYKEKTNIKLDREYIVELFDLMDQDHGKSISVQEFILSYMVIEEKLRHKQFHLKHVIEEYSILKQKCEKERQINKDEKLNAFGISLTAELSISVLEAYNLQPTSFSGDIDPYVLIIFDGKEQTTSFKESTYNPVWNENFFFPVRSLESIIEIKLIDKKSKDIIGANYLVAKEFKDQEKVEKTIVLKPLSGNEIMGELKLRVRIFWSKLQYYNNKIAESEEKIEMAIKDINEVKEYLRLIEEPFGLIIYGQISHLRDEDILDPPRDRDLILEKKRLSLMPSQSFNSKRNPSLANKIDVVIKSTFKTNVEWSSLSKFLMYILVVLSCLQMVERSDFIGMVMGIGIWYIFINNENIQTLEIYESISRFLNIMSIAIIYDILWLFFHSDSYWYDTDSDKTIKELTYIFAFCNLIVKTMLCLSLWINFNKEKLKKKEKQLADIRRSVYEGYSNSSKLDKGRFSIANYIKNDKNPFN